MNFEEISDSTILIIDDNPTNLRVLSDYLTKIGFKILVKKNGNDGLQLAIRKKPDLILLDIMMPEINGYDTCKALKENKETKEIPIIFMSALSETFDKIKAFDIGGLDYITKPFQMEEVLARVKTHLTIYKQKAALEHELKVSQELFNEAYYNTNGELLGKSFAIRSIHKSILQYSNSNENLMLVGSKGSGEEAIARAIHKSSSRTQKAFIYVNCTDFNKITSTAFSTDTVELGQKIREKFQLANGGTLYLEAIEEIPVQEQRDLLDIINFSNNELPEAEQFDVRIISHASDHLKLSERLHQQLYAYLIQNMLRIPSLLERQEDIPILADYYTRQQANWLGKSIDSISQASLDKLKQHSWPGNLRELRNVIERSMMFVNAGQLEVDEELLLQGQRIGRYRLIDQIGVGGMGEVWRARHQLLARPAALKLIKEDLGHKETNFTRIQRFQLEAQIIANLQSPNTIRLYDYGITESGKLYYVMELLNGLNLEEIVTKFGPMQPERVGVLLGQACRSLMEAHNNGLIHRDIKPQNLFVCKLGLEYDFLKVLDFGMVKQMTKQEDIPSLALTDEKKIMGTPLCMAPEQLGGKGAQESSDLYSLGCTAYWMLTGEFPFGGENLLNLVMAHVSEPPAPPSLKTKNNIPPQLEKIILACLEKKPENRPTSVHELWKNLEEVQYSDPWTREKAESWWKTNIPEEEKEEEKNSSI